MRSALFNILLFLVIGYGLMLAGLFLLQRKLMYHPDQDRSVPAQYRLYEALALTIPGHDALPLFSWYQEPSATENRIILYFHGNAGSIADRSDKAQRFVKNGFGILLPSYRYNAGNGGEPSEESLIADGLAAYQWLLDQGYAPDQIILYGESLGTGVAVALAAKNETSAIILEAPYSSVADVAQGAYWYLPARWLVHDPFSSTDRIGNVKAPILIVHGAKDRTIPIKYGKRLHQSAPEGTEFRVLPNAGHADLYDHGMADAVFDFLSGSKS